MTLYIEGHASSGYATVTSFSEENVTVFKGKSSEAPPSFERSCVFRVLSLDNGAELGTPIRFGSTITLTHNLTQKMIAKKSGDSGQQSHRVFLKPVVSTDGNEDPPEQCWFRPMPRIKLYSEGDPIKFDSQVLIESAHGIGSRYVKDSSKIGHRFTTATLVVHDHGCSV